MYGTSKIPFTPSTLEGVYGNFTIQIQIKSSQVNMWYTLLLFMYCRSIMTISSLQLKNVCPEHDKSKWSVISWIVNIIAGAKYIVY